jgi:hypothetical protein
MTNPAQLPRRAVVLAGPLAALAGNLPSTATEAIANDATATALLEEVRRRAAELLAAINTECELEGKPGYAAACARAEALQAEFNALSDTIWARPVRSWDDVIARAEIASHYAPREWGTHRLADLTSACWHDRSLAHLLEAVLRLGGRHV